MMWMLLVMSLVVTVALLSAGMLVSALMIGQALSQAHNLEGIDLDVTDLNPRMASLESQEVAITTTARWTGAVVR